jgi:hypothetical protein
MPAAVGDPVTPVAEDDLIAYLGSARSHDAGDVEQDADHERDRDDGHDQRGTPRVRRWRRVLDRGG